MPRVKKEFDVFENCLPTRLPALGEKVWVHFAEAGEWVEGEVSRYAVSASTTGFLIKLNNGTPWWWDKTTFYCSNKHNKLKVKRVTT